MNKYAYVTLLYPNKRGECTYLDGALLVGLGLKKQKVKHKIICMLTKDVNNDIRSILKNVFDEIIVVDYITPVKNKGITINGDIFFGNHYFNDNNFSSICHVFTKLHIFDSNIFPYEKIVFIDSDVVPLKDYDELFKLDTPAGWLEQILELNTGVGNHYTKIWGKWKIKHGDGIPKLLTDIYKVPGTCINAGLLVIKPDKKVYDFFIEQLQTKKEKWFGQSFIHKGCIDVFRNEVDYYPFPEQCYLTQHFSGEWHMIDGLYASWGLQEGSLGIHMAGLKYNVAGQVREYKSWMLQIPEDNGCDKTTNDVVLWGLREYPILKDSLFRNLKIKFEENLIPFKDIKKDDIYFEKLSRIQKNIHKIITSL